MSTYRNMKAAQSYLLGYVLNINKDSLSVKRKQMS
jgi:hypothetical protein